jgi:hypothetical protein
VALASTPDSEVRRAEYIDALDNTKVIQVSYTTGEAGNRLTWLPERPSKPAVARRAEPLRRIDAAVQNVQFNEPQLAPPQAPAPSGASESTAKSDPFQDPFGDDKLGQLEPPSLPEALPLDGDRPQPLPSPPLQVRPSQPRTPEDEMPGLDELAQAPATVEPCRTPKELMAAGELKRINQITYDISATAGNFPQECSLGDDIYQPRSWCTTTFTWTASALCHKPLYFEDVHLERYGHSWGHYVQPFVSGAHFFLAVPLLPYKMGLYPPHECMYTLGYYRPGSCAPYMLDPLPLSIRAGLFEAAAWTGGVFLIP